MSSLPPDYSEVKQEIENKSYVKVEVISTSENEGCLALSSLKTFDKNENTRTPVDLVFVIDRSGSMGSAVAGSMESCGYTRFDLVRHAIDIVSQNLSKNDFFTLILFSDDAKVVIPRCPATENNLTNFKKQLATVQCKGMTNLYDALKTAYTYLKMNPLVQAQEEFINRHIVVLGDGQPTIEVPHQCSYEKLIEEEKRYCNPLLHMFGITCDELDDKLLHNIAIQGNGMYGFISDATIVSPCFINILGVIFNMMYTGLTLSIKDVYSSQQFDCFIPWILQDGTVEFEVPAYLLHRPHENSCEVFLSSNKSRKMRTQYSQSDNKEFVQMFQVRKSIAKELQGICDKIGSNNKQLLKQNLDLVLQSLIDTKETKVTGWKNIHQKEWFETLYSDVNLFGRIKHESLQIWGSFCLRSLSASLNNDYVTNAYEKSYKTKIGARLQFWLTKIENVAKNIEPPNPSYKPYQGDTGSNNNHTNSYQAPPPAFSDYFSSSSSRDYDDGCVDGECLVSMADGTLKKVKDVVIGDKVVIDQLNNLSQNNVSQVGQIRCSLLIPSKEFVELPNGLRITHMHPICCDTKENWIFPKDHSEKQWIKLKEPVNMYSFLLEKNNAGNAMKINSYWVVHFAHNNQHPVLNHKFYGTDLIRDTVERIDDQKLGRIRVTKALRDQNDQVCDYTGIAFM